MVALRVNHRRDVGGTTINSEKRSRTPTGRVRINQDIRARDVRLIGADGEQVGVVSLKDALSQARESELDLVEISPNAEPPVCRIMDFGKFQFEQNKRQAAAKKKQKQIQVKEIKFRPGIEEGDFQVKLRNLLRFLESGDKVKVTVRFRGREMAHQNLGQNVLQRLEESVGDNGVVEAVAKREGRQLVMVFAPKKKSGS